MRYAANATRWASRCGQCPRRWEFWRSKAGCWRERDRCAKQVKARTVDHERLSAELRAALETCDAVAAERDGLKADRDALAVQQEVAVGERDQLAHDLDRLRRGAAPKEASEQGH